MITSDAKKVLIFELKATYPEEGS